MQTIILTGRYVDPSLRQLYGNIPACLIPVNGQPLLERIIESVPADFRDQIILGIGEGGQAVVDFCRRGGFRGGRNIAFKEVDPAASAGKALDSLLDQLPSAPTLVLLGDTLLDIDRAHLADSPVIFTAAERAASAGWSYVLCDDDQGVVESISDLSQDCLPPPHAQLVVGGFYLPAHDPRQATGSSPNSSILDVLYARCQIKPFVARPVAAWFDFGHIDTYHRSKKALLQSRHFNSLTFDDLRGTVLKRSTNVEKFTQEIAWYSALPPPLQVFAPRVISSAADPQHDPLGPHIELEYYGYPSLAELYVHKQFDVAFFHSVIDRIFRVLGLFRSHGREVTRDDARAMYLDKTLDRIDAFAAESELNRALLGLRQLTINGQTYQGWPELHPRLQASVESVCASMMACFIHGDLCFSNILYDPGSGIVRIIDPRGKWGGDIGAGDQQYDIAKLRHSIAGLYDFIIAKKYTLEQESDRFWFEVHAPKSLFLVREYFDANAAKFCDIQSIQLIEALLFLSMLPLHSDNRDRQVALFLTGVMRLNEVLELTPA